MQTGEILEKFEQNVLLKGYTAFKIGGPARYFFRAKTKQDLIEAIKAAKQNNLSFFILGGGSNLLVNDKGYDGLVIKMENSRIELFGNKGAPKIYVESGALLSSVVARAIKNSLSGMEWAIGIPGTVGGAVAGNAGAFEMSMSDVVKSVEAIDISQFSEVQLPKIRNLENEDCRFGYRDSIFRHNKNLIVFSADLELKTGEGQEIQKATKEFLERRQNTQPKHPSAGSVFKNVKIKNQSAELQSKIKKDRNIKSVIKNDIIPAGYLIEKCGLKGKRIGDVQISEKHCNFFVNLGQARASDALELINLAKRAVKQKFGIDLQEEIVIL